MAAGEGTVAPPSILVVEDHPDSVRVMARLLKLSGFDSLGVATCADALAAAATRRFDLVLCDLGLSDGDGCALFQQLRAQYGLTGIAYTGSGSPDDRARSRAAGFTAHLLKPINFDDLLAAVRAALAITDATPPPNPAATASHPTPASPSPR